MHHVLHSYIKIIISHFKCFQILIVYCSLYLKLFLSLLTGLHLLYLFAIFFLLPLIANSISDFRFTFLDFLFLWVAAKWEGLLSSNFLSRGLLSNSSLNSCLCLAPLDLSLAASLAPAERVGGLTDGFLMTGCCCGCSRGISGLLSSASILKTNIRILEILPAQMPKDGQC